MNNCAICNKELEKDCGQFCESDCGRLFCSYECAQLEGYEETFPNCCPGVYWCILCRNEYLDATKGHFFMIKNHEKHQDLKTYLGLDPDEPIFSEACMKCDIWHYQFKSQTDIAGIYEGQECTEEFRLKMLNEVEKMILESIIECPSCKLNGDNIYCLNFEGPYQTWATFTDLAGHDHYHSSKIIKATYKCSNNHVFDIKPINSCWCGWQEPVIEPHIMAIENRKISLFERIKNLLW